MKFPLMIHPIGWLALLALLPGCGPGKSGQPPELPPQEVGIVTLQPRRAEIVTELPGRTTAYRVAEVRPQVSGIILKRFFTEGADVKEGDQLYQIDPAAYQAAYDSATANVAKTQAALDIAALNLNRQKELATKNVVSRQNYDDAFAAWKQAQADHAAALAAQETARIDVVYTKVLAPISGRIGRSRVTEGALVTSQQVLPLAVVHQLDPMYVDITQSSSQLLRLKRDLAAGQLQGANPNEANARLVLEDGTDYSEPGKVEFSEVSVDEGTGSVTLRAVFPNPNGELLPGMFVRTFVTEGANEQAILAPQRGVTRNPKGQPVATVVGEGDKVEARVLAVDRVIDNHWLVTDGLKAGDRLIVEGLQKIAPGAPVRPVEVAETADASAQPREN